MPHLPPCLSPAASPEALTVYDEFHEVDRHCEIMELIGMAAFAVYANIIADATAMNADEMFGQL